MYKSAMRTRILAISIAASLTIAASAQSPSGDVEAAFKAFWDADTVSAAEKAGPKILTTGAGFDTIAKRLAAGRPYAKQRTGRIDMASSDHGTVLDNVVDVPADYDPARK